MKLNVKFLKVTNCGCRKVIIINAWKFEKYNNGKKLKN